MVSEKSGARLFCGGDQLYANPYASEHNIGLDHVAFGCESRVDLEQWVQRLNKLGITHGGVVDAHHGSGLSFRDPDGITLEFFAPQA